MTVNAGNNVTMSGSSIEAANDVNLSSKDDVNILAVNDSEYHYHRESEFFRQKSYTRSYWK